MRGNLKLLKIHLSQEQFEAVIQIVGSVLTSIIPLVNEVQDQVKKSEFITDTDSGLDRQLAALSLSKTNRFHLIIFTSAYCIFSERGLQMLIERVLLELNYTIDEFSFQLSSAQGIVTQVRLSIFICNNLGLFERYRFISDR